jgi:hypothetical protein
MAQQAYSTQSNPASGVGQGVLFGIPVNGLGWFASLLIGLAMGFAAFFAATFCGIVFILIADSGFHQTLDYAWSYRRIGLPVGSGVGVVSLAYLGWLWVRRVIGRP